MLSWAKPSNLTSSGISDPSIPEACGKKEQEEERTEQQLCEHNEQEAAPNLSFRPTETFSQV